MFRLDRSLGGIFILISTFGGLIGYMSIMIGRQIIYIFTRVENHVPWTNPQPAPLISEDFPI